MKEYSLTLSRGKANPTIETQNKIIEVIERAESPLSLTAISKLSKTGFYETKSSITFLHKLGIIDLVVSSGNVTLVTLKTGVQKNATA